MSFAFLFLATAAATATIVSNNDGIIFNENGSDYCICNSIDNDNSANKKAPSIKL